MKKVLVIYLILLIAVPSFGALKFGVGLGPGILPPSNIPMAKQTEGVDYYNGKMIATKDDNLDHMTGSLNPVTSVSVNEIGAPIGILGGLNLIASGDNFIAYLSGMYLTSLGGCGDITYTDTTTSTKMSSEIDSSASAISFTLTAGPKIQVSDLTCVYLQLGLGYTSLTLNEKLTLKVNDTIIRIPAGPITEASYDRKYTGAGLFIPMIIGAEIKLMDNIALGMDAAYSSGTALVKYKGKEYLDSTTNITKTTSVDLTGLAMLVSVKYYFSL